MPTPRCRLSASWNSWIGADRRSADPALVIAPAHIGDQVSQRHLVLENEIDGQHPGYFLQVRDRPVQPAQPDGILFRRHRNQVFCTSALEQFLRVGIGEGMVIAEGATRRDRVAGALQRVEEFGRIANA